MKTLIVLLFVIFTEQRYEDYTVVVRESGIASTYYPGDGHSGKTCADGKPFTKERCHVAHRRGGPWQLGRTVRVCSHKTKRCTITYMGDTGPFGTCEFGLDTRRRYRSSCQGRHFVKVRTRTGWITRSFRNDGKGWTHHTKDPGGSYRGVLDMSVCVRNKIGGGRGLQFVTVELLRPKRRTTSQWLTVYANRTTRAITPYLRLFRSLSAVAIDIVAPGARTTRVTPKGGTTDTTLDTMLRWMSWKDA